LKHNLYDGYRAYQCLEEERVQRLIRDNLVISLHDHPQVYARANEEILAYSREGRALS